MFLLKIWCQSPWGNVNQILFFKKQKNTCNDDYRYTFITVVVQKCKKIFIEVNVNDTIMKDYNGLFEKKKIKWMKLSDYKENNNILKLRTWYKPIIDSVSKNEKFLIKQIKNLEKQ